MLIPPDWSRVSSYVRSVFWVLAFSKSSCALQEGLAFQRETSHRFSIWSLASILMQFFAASVGGGAENTVAKLIAIGLAGVSAM
jgi:hypothetical protein